MIWLIYLCCSELLWPSLFIQMMMSLLLQGENIEMMVLLIMLKARKVNKVMNGWKMRSMSKKIDKGRCECVQRTGIVSEVFFYSWCSFAQLSVTPLLISSVSNSIARWDNSIITVNKYLIVHKQLLILHWNTYRSHCYDIVTLWSQ